MSASTLDRMREDRDRFVGFAFAHADLLLELDAAGRVTWAGGAVQSVLGEEAAKIIGRPLVAVLAAHDGILLTAVLRDLTPGQRQRDLHLVLRQNGGMQQAIDVCIHRFLDPRDCRFFLSISLAPIHTPQQASGRSRDRVTGLLEAVDFTRVATSAVQSARLAGKSACLTLVEICETTELTRLLGAERADALMGEIGAQLKLHAIDHDAAAKIGDGKFSVTHFETGDRAALTEAIGRVGDSFSLDRATLKLAEKTIAFDAHSLDDSDVESILSYIVRKFGCDGMAGMEAEEASHYLRRMTAETLSRVVNMRDIIHERRIILHYQPIVGMSDRGVHHYEVLLRFEDGRSPFEDVQFAEEINIIYELDLAVTRGAIGRIKEAAQVRHDLSLAVNMSARSLLNDTFLTMFEQLTHGLDRQRSRLIVEITESAKLEDLPKAARAVDRLKAGGHTICLDDFGAGASSLPYLQQLLVDYVKIDGAYIRSITESRRERAIVQGVLTTCKCLGIKTVAEMIEKEDQHKCLLSLGVDLGQGWLYGRPEPHIEPVVRGVTRLGHRTGVQEHWS